MLARRTPPMCTPVSTISPWCARRAPRLLDERVAPSAAMRAARERRRAEGAVLVAAVLDAQQRARAGLSRRRRRRSAARRRAPPRAPRDRRPATSASHRGSARESARRALGGERRGAAHHDRRSAGCWRAARRTAWRRSATASAVTAQLLNTATSASSGDADDRRRRGVDHRADRFGVVLVGATAEGAQVQLSRRAAHAASPLPIGATRGGCSGSQKWNALPCRSPALFTQMRPPCASTTSLQNARPSPELRTRGMCGVFTCSNFRKMRSWYSGGMPDAVVGHGEQRAGTRRVRAPSVHRDRARRVRERVLDQVAEHALDQRLVGVERPARRRRRRSRARARSCCTRISHSRATSLSSAAGAMRREVQHERATPPAAPPRAGPRSGRADPARASPRRRAPCAGRR